MSRAMPSTRSTYAWAQLTWPQIEAVLALAKAADKIPGALNHYLPERGQRAALRGAVEVLTRLKVAGEALEAGPERRQ